MSCSLERDRVVGVESTAGVLQESRRVFQVELDHVSQKPAVTTQPIQRCLKIHELGGQGIVLSLRITLSKLAPSSLHNVKRRAMPQRLFKFSASRQSASGIAFSSKTVCKAWSRGVQVDCDASDVRR
jgi:hypothetical protein